MRVNFNINFMARPGEKTVISPMVEYQDSARKVQQLVANFWAGFDAAATEGALVSSDGEKYSTEQIQKMRANLERELAGIMNLDQSEKHSWLLMLNSEVAPPPVDNILRYATSSSNTRGAFKLLLRKILEAEIGTVI